MGAPKINRRAADADATQTQDMCPVCYFAHGSARTPANREVHIFLFWFSSIRFETLNIVLNKCSLLNAPLQRPALSPFHALED